MLLFHLKGKLFLFSLIVLLIFSGCKRDELILNEDSSRLPVSDLKVDYAFDMKIGLSWGDADYNGYYYIFIAKNSPEIDSMKFFTWSSERYADINVENYETEYFFAVSKSMDNNSSIFSNIVSAKAINIYNPGSPIFLNSTSINSDSAQINLGWTNRDNDISYAEIYRNETGIFNYSANELVGKTNSPLAFEDLYNLKVNTTYFYSIILYDFGGLKSEPSIPFSNLIMDKPEIIFPPDNQDVSLSDTLIYKTNSHLIMHSLNVILENNANPADGVISVEYFPNSASEIVKVPVGELGLSINKIYRLVITAGERSFASATGHRQYSNTLIIFRIK